MKKAIAILVAVFLGIQLGHQAVLQLGLARDGLFSSDDTAGETIATETSEGPAGETIATEASEGSAGETIATEASDSTTGNAAIYAKYQESIDVAMLSPSPVSRKLSVGDSDSPCIWSPDVVVYSSDESVLTISDAGVVTAVGKGTAYAVFIPKLSITVSENLGSGLITTAYKYIVR